MIFSNGSKIITIKIDKNSTFRGKRSNIINWYDENLGCFVTYDGNKYEDEQYSFWDLEDE